MPTKLPIYVSDLELGVTLNTLLDKALKPNTQRTYNHAQNRLAPAGTSQFKFLHTV